MGCHLSVDCADSLRPEISPAAPSQRHVGRGFALDPCAFVISVPATTNSSWIICLGIQFLMVWGSIKNFTTSVQRRFQHGSASKGTFPIDDAQRRGVVTSRFVVALRRTALRSLGRCGRPKISVPANWKRIVYMYTSIIIQHHPTSSNIIHHHPTSSSYLCTIFSSGLLCSEAPNLHPSMGVATCEPSHRQSLLLDTSFFPPLG